MNSKNNSCATVEDIQDAPLTSASHPSRKRGWTGFRMGFAAMIAIVVLFVSTATASALGLNIWDALAKWTGEVFGFSAEQEEPHAVKQLKVLQNDMVGYGITANVLPTYLPEGYEVVSTKSQAKEDYIRFDCLLSDGVNSMILNYTLHLSDNFIFEFEKAMQSPEKYECNGVTHYIMDNSGTYFAAWMLGDVECNIFGASTREELIKIIDSIYGE